MARSPRAARRRPMTRGRRFRSRSCRPASAAPDAPAPIFCRLPTMTCRLRERPLATTTVAVASTGGHQALLDLAAGADDIDELAELARAEATCGTSSASGCSPRCSRTRTNWPGSTGDRIGDRRARDDRAGGAVDGVVEEGERRRGTAARLAAGQTARRRLGPRARCSLDLGQFGLARIEGGVDRVELDQGVQRRPRRADHGAIMDLTAADTAGEGRPDLGIAEIELGGADRRLVGR